MNRITKVPPIKSQGIKTKLVPWIKSIVPDDFSGRWIEPFMGTGVVAFNVAPSKAILCDTNPHIINFYTQIATGEITPGIVKAYLIKEGDTLLCKAVAVSKDDDSAAIHAAMANVAGLGSISGCGGLIQTTSG